MYKYKLVVKVNLCCAAGRSASGGNNSWIYNKHPRLATYLHKPVFSLTQ